MKLQTSVWLLLFSLFLMPIYSQSTDVEKYNMVEISVGSEELVDLYSLGLAIECSYVSYSNGTYVFTVPVHAHDMTLLQGTHLRHRIVIEDVASFYANRAASEDMSKLELYRQTLGTDMQFGTMGGFYKVEEVYQTLDKLYEKYGSKNLITAKQSIGTSVEGRPIYMVKISDNANVDEEESQALYTSLTHAREPGGMMTLFYFMYYLLENYESNQRVRNIVDNRELYFIPILNVDGYAYNQKNSPNGGGMWRKNRNSSGTVDLNRNFGPHELWNYPNGGSSTSPYSDTYRGTAAFSEPETRALRDFVNSKNIKTALNNHTYSNLLIYPWGYRNEVAHPTFKTMAIEMTKINGYEYGTAPELLYPVRGVSDDWFYFDKKVFAMTPEIGSRSDGFWPSQSRIFPLAQENLESNMLLSEYAGQVALDETMK